MTTYKESTEPKRAEFTLQNPATSAAQAIFPEIGAGGFSRLNTTVAFYTRINALLAHDMALLDFGAGRGQRLLEDPITFRRNLQMFKGKVRKVIAADVDPVVLSNPGADEAVVLELLANGQFSIPLPNDSIDIIVSDWTFEHISNPEAAVAEFDRVLRPGGWICARTPTKWGYIGLGNTVVPASQKRWLLRMLQPERKEEDVFPTVYRMNSFAQLRILFPTANWHSYSYTVDADPAYAGHNTLLWRLFRTIGWLTPPPFLPVLLIFLRKLR